MSSFFDTIHTDVLERIAKWYSRIRFVSNEVALSRMRLFHSNIAPHSLKLILDPERPFYHISYKSYNTLTVSVDHDAQTLVDGNLIMSPTMTRQFAICERLGVGLKSLNLRIPCPFVVRNLFQFSLILFSCTCVFHLAIEELTMHLTTCRKFLNSLEVLCVESHHM